MIYIVASNALNIHNFIYIYPNQVKQGKLERLKKNEVLNIFYLKYNL